MYYVVMTNRLLFSVIVKMANNILYFAKGQIKPQADCRAVDSPEN